MLRRRRAMVAAMGGGAAAVQYGDEQTLTLQPDEATSVDAMIHGGSTTFNYGTIGSIQIGHNGTATRRGLIKFDLSSIPADAKINSATLSLYATQDVSANARTYRVYRLLRAWVEGTRAGASDSPATGATWVRYDTVSNWATAGGFGAADCEQTDIGSRAFTATETLNEMKDFPITASAIEEITSGAFTNNGFLIKADTEDNDGYNFASSSDATASHRPKFVIKYQVPL